MLVLYGHLHRYCTVRISLSLSLSLSLHACGTPGIAFHHSIHTLHCCTWQTLFDNFTGYLEPVLEQLRRPGERLAVAETGAITTNITIQFNDLDSNVSDSWRRQCQPLLVSNVTKAVRWLQYLSTVVTVGNSSSDRDGTDATSGGWDLLTWWSDADYLPAAVEMECYGKACSFPHRTFIRHKTVVRVRLKRYSAQTRP